MPPTRLKVPNLKLMVAAVGATTMDVMITMLLGSINCLIHLQLGDFEEGLKAGWKELEDLRRMTQREEGSYCYRFLSRGYRTSSDQIDDDDVVGVKCMAETKGV